MKTIYDTGKRTSELLQDLKQLVEIPSVRDAGISAPFGKEIRNAMDVFLQIAQREGFSVHDFDGYAVDAQLGEGDDYIGVLAHLDVVEAGERSHWHGDPFQMREIDGMLYGRGVNDDKGPLLAAYRQWPVSGRKVVHCIIRSASLPEGLRKQHGNAWSIISSITRNQSAAFPRMATFPLSMEKRGFCRYASC